ncbi:L-histidine N(alpha)-methyltransferase [Piscinibacter sp.]|uniref:L-histidine N(alpha)-methyltransferase n=1 Tax=Piscinibacter sp. TaxID=1903157 RepID=UPI002B95A839|nr:L-histidine N(alpha)-methyltransferase [Albitalea sp.]HUG23870.1 L-histidine N(alpha)-methyltransferase [Albitalea sp.]
MTKRTPRFIRTHDVSSHDERLAAIEGLMAKPPQGLPKHFYDRLGSHLFDAITELPEYYPTRTEAALFAAHGAQMARAIGGGSTFIDLGAGNCAKAARLLPLLDPARYIAVDISADYLQDALRDLQRQHPALDIVGVGMDFSRSPALPAGLLGGDASRPVFFYPGSSIGNFKPTQAEKFLAGIRAQAQGGGLLIGVDLVKPVNVLEAAYDDALGVTAAFNLNLLRNLNRIIGADFEPRQWRHVALFNTVESRIEMHLEAREAMTVQWPGGERRFDAGERIHTENSYKYSVASFGELLGRAGFRGHRVWTAPNEWFAVFWSEA